ncbi:hypothetical protein QA600_06745 [Natronococcus sp. A-GB1]|uniref:DUF7344 domain-containing protein n=1 Tax=Natronococcus sp. A-GB1 TaxID=3037648 RepID=UPI00241D5A70|nr:hypothetical protein [Natronococcus sp. A-GB1]MDG5759035.1 hypothetical protein [Natronococcus sp. A-GB1]
MSDSNQRSDMIGGGGELCASDRIDEILRSLGDARRRRLISYVREQGPTSRTDAARQLAAWKNDTSPATLSDEAVERAEIALHHKHLPALEDARLVEYDSRSETLLVRDLPELAERCLECCGLAERSASP